MKRAGTTIVAAVLVAFCVAGLLRAQQPNFPQVMPADSVYGSQYVSGPGVAIPFNVLAQRLLNTQVPGVTGVPQVGWVPQATSSTTASWAPGRIKLAAGTTFYSDTVSGSNNATCGLAPGALACNTLQYLFATRFVPNYDCGGQAVTLSFANNDAVGLNISTAWAGGCQVTIQGPGGSPPSIGINTTGSAIQVFAPLPAPLNLTGFKVTSTNGPSVVIYAPGTVNISNGMNIGATAGTQLQASGPGALINCIGGAGYTISGGGYAHWLAINLGQVGCGAIPITITGTPAFTYFAQATGLGEIFVSGTSFSGSATGARYNASLNGAILTNTGGNPTFFPGNSAGSTATGGQYQ